MRYALILLFLMGPSIASAETFQITSGFYSYVGNLSAALSFVGDNFSIEGADEGLERVTGPGGVTAFGGGLSLLPGDTFAVDLSWNSPVRGMVNGELDLGIHESSLILSIHFTSTIPLDASGSGFFVEGPATLTGNFIFVGLFGTRTVGGLSASGVARTFVSEDLFRSGAYIGGGSGTVLFPVPEPTTWLLLLSGLACLCGSAWFSDSLAIRTAVSKARRRFGKSGKKICFWKVACFTASLFIIHFNDPSSVNATITAFESGQAMMDLNTVQFNTVDISILGKSSSSSVGAFSGIGPASSSVNSTAPVFSNAQTTLQGINALAFTDGSLINAQASFSLTYDGFFTAGYSGFAIASTTINFMALETGELSVLGNYLLNGTFGGSGDFFAHTQTNWAPSFQVSFALGGYQYDPNNFNTSGYTEYGFLNIVPHIGLFGLHGFYRAGDIGSLTITTTTRFFYSDPQAPEPTTLVLLASGLAGLALLHGRLIKRKI